MNKVHLVMKSEEFYKLEKRGKAKPHHRVLASLERVREIAESTDDLNVHRADIQRICEKALTWSGHIFSSHNSKDRAREA